MPKTAYLNLKITQKTKDKLLKMCQQELRSQTEMIEYLIDKFELKNKSYS